MKNFIILSVLIFSFTACKKEKYNGYQAFWYDYMTSHDLDELANVSDLTLYVDDEFISTIDASVYYMKTPHCKEGQFLYTDKMYKKEDAEHNFKILDQDNNIIWKGKFKTRESECHLILLVF